ncbi:MAG: hypothetical protein Q7U57_13450 [Methylovulum sp.]|nr:hypothetical protein [Methylovulum sp.]
MEADKASAVLSLATVPIANQFEPALVLYCQTPSVPLLAVLPTTATPLKLEPVSTSAKLRPVNALIAEPAGLDVSSLTADKVRLPKPVGASLTAATSTFTWTAVVEAAVPSYALTVKALRLEPLASAAAFQYHVPPVLSNVAPAVT